MTNGINDAPKPITTIHIPPAALEAGKRELYPHMFTGSHDMAREIARAAFVAMIKSWDGMRVDDTYRWLSEVAIILPMEDKNAEG